MSDKSSDEIARSNLNILIQTAITQEQDRIIKLLEESLIYDEPVVIQRNQLIELIKGENK